MDWIVFGDDWGVHPSTTQHLILNLPPADAVIWIDSIGMRQPRFRIEDLKRIWQKIRGFAQGSSHENALYKGTVGDFGRIKPKVLPWHLNSAVRRFNTAYLRRTLRGRLREHGFHESILLASDPVVVRYAGAIPYEKLVYLRLDDYARYPGVDPRLVLETERLIFERADAIFVTAKALVPEAAFADKTHYLPQGVQVEHFSPVPLEPPRNKILGFFGTVSEWLDFDLIERVATAAPDWELRFIGKIDYLPERINRIRNVRFCPPIPFAELPCAMAEWTAAWIPFLINELTKAVNPLKVREYLAAGIASHCTPLPEVQALSNHVRVTDAHGEIVRWMEGVRAKDSASQRLARRQYVEEDSWASRSAEMRQVVQGV